MIRKFSFLPVALLLLSFNGVAQAEFIIGAKVGVLTIGTDNVALAATKSLQLGYEFLNLVAADVAAEVEVASSLSEGDGPSGSKYSYAHQGLFASVRTIGPIYAIGRAGLINDKITFTLGNRSAEMSDSGAAVGVGLGFSTGVRMELELTTYKFKKHDIRHLSLQISF